MQRAPMSAGSESSHEGGSVLTEEGLFSSRPRALVVDDDEGIRYSLHRCLTGADFEVLTASNLSEAKTCLLAARFDLSFIDLFLSEGESGLDLLPFLKEHQPVCEAILISGDPSFEPAVEATRNGVFACLAKPLSKETIREVAKQAVEKNLACKRDRRGNS